MNQVFRHRSGDGDRVRGSRVTCGHRVDIGDIQRLLLATHQFPLRQPFQGCRFTL